MACNCTKCSSKCSCADTALTNPCSYTDCSVGSERCDDIQCAACVSYCGTSFQIGDTSNQIVITSGERLDSIIQKFSMILANGLGACTSNDVQHDPFNVFAGTITSLFFFKFRDFIAISSASVPFATPKQYFTFKYFENIFS